ncbi:feruloyl esterase, putative [Talaromyces stipitatus ATCC 10500]|uniref:Carboxylic ester hydrolase n=1 Tax=Talaromyces stipitatus (strain ATCC 10500 / CBS 375.48 / QM 6759 / NRRL 1006) TaxID=441959 RepID=B8LVK8_TALSN|nr:feruloyl esterase, putative [Talaromyces stipitatus ATCC 10500]EED24027.1 feruloyl esterase, putative [Talaromyces stipitatus ATCC 10500]
MKALLLTATLTPYPTDCSHLSAPHVSGAKVLSINATERWNYSVPATPPFLFSPVQGLNICDVTVLLTHTGALHRQVTVKVWLPLQDWNGKFQANGGSGYAAGELDLTLGPTVKEGYSSASTDAGVGLNPLSPEAWALNKDGSVDFDALIDFSYRSVHDMAIVGKELTRQFYGTKPKYSYWNGCSTGGRQGMVAAQRYPDLFDGILVGAPAINWAKYVVAEQWPQVVMQQEQTFLSACELKFFSDAAINACDEMDGVKDGIITDPENCSYDPFQSVGQVIQCDGHCITITNSSATVIRKTLYGPLDPFGRQLWYGLNPGAPLDSLVNSTTNLNGTRVGNSFFVNDQWIRYFLARDPNYNTTQIDYDTFLDFFWQSYTEYDGIIGTDDADLSSFNHHGGKLLMWQGLSDQLIFPGGTINYRDRVEHRMGGANRTNDFFRLFLAPGVDHCAVGTTVGATPDDPFLELANWVEQGQAPETIPATVNDGTEAKRIICAYPQVATYCGGDTKSATSYKCV